MIARLWRGWTSQENADAFERFLREQLFPSLHSIAGFHGADLLRRDAGDEVAFVTLLRFESIDGVREFAGENYEQAVIKPEAEALLTRHDEHAEHFEVAVQNG